MRECENARMHLPQGERYAHGFEKESERERERERERTMGSGIKVPFVLLLLDERGV